MNEVCVAFSGFKMLQMYRCIYTGRQAPRDASSSEKENIERRDEKATSSSLSPSFLFCISLRETSQEVGEAEIIY